MANSSNRSGQYDKFFKVMRVKVIIGLLFFIRIIHAQTELSFDSDNIDYLDNNAFFAATGISNTQLRFVLASTEENVRDKWVIKPTDRMNLDFYLRYKWLNVNISYAPQVGFANNEEETKGKSSVFNINVHAFVFKKSYQNFQYSRFKGFYIENLPVENSFVQLPNFSINNLSFTSTFFHRGLKDEYRSYKLITYMPKKDNYLITSSFDFKYTYYRDIDLIRTLGEDTYFFDEIETFHDLQFSYRLGGAFQKFFFEKFYASLELQPSFTVLHNTNFEDTQFTFGNQTFFRIGYVNNRYFGGLGFNHHYTMARDDFFATNLLHLYTYFGYKFDLRGKKNK